MFRIRVQLTRQQLQTLRQLSQAIGRPIAELIRQDVELCVGSQQGAHRNQQIEGALRVTSRFSSGSGDGRLEHVRHLAEALRR